MKNLIKFFMVMAVLCTVAACNQTFEDVGKSVKEQETEQGRLVMNIGSESRTIIPIITENDIKSARLTANGMQIGSWSGNDIIGQIENDKSILLDVGIYDFEMTFCNENGNVFLMGTIGNKEIKAGDNSLVFDMKLVQGNGNIAIGISWEADSKISKIKAGLYDIATGKAVAGYEAEEIAINGTQAEYLKNDVPTGQYIIKFELYKEDDKLLNTVTDVVKVVAEKTTTEQKVLNNINALYTIKYNLNGGNWKKGFTPVTVRNANTGIVLPTADNIEKTNCMFSYWYDEIGNKITEILGNTAKDITVTAKWVEYPQEGFVYVQGATITGGITAEGYTTSSIFKDGRTVPVGDFYMSDHEVTQAEYEKYCSSSDSDYGDGRNYPAHFVRWFDALVYCNKRSRAEGLTSCYKIKGSTNTDDWGRIPYDEDDTNWDKWWGVTCDFTANGYRLPTEAEWEYAARGGNGLAGYQYKYAGSDTLLDVAWYTGSEYGKTHTVKDKNANGLGLYDMSGNVWEWCWDADSSSSRYLRGGSWNNSAGYCTVSSRYDGDAFDSIGNNSTTYNQCHFYGFRVVRTVDFFTSLVGCIAYSDGSISVDYDSTKTPIGIVIEATDDKATKIVSLTETKAQWSTEEVTTKATSITDGAANMTAIQSIDGWEEKYPAFKWCDDYTDASGNSEWYLPTNNELNQLYTVKYYVNVAIDKIIAGGGTATSLGTGKYWSSSQTNNYRACFQRFSDGSQYSLYANDYYKDNRYSVRAVRAF